MSDSTSLIIHDLSTLDQLELQGQFSPDEIRFDQQKTDNTMLGDIGVVTAIVIISLGALRALSIYLVKKSDKRSFKKRIEVEDANGNRKSIEIEFDSNSSEPAEKQIYQQLAQACSIDLGQLGQLIHPTT